MLLRLFAMVALVLGSLTALAPTVCPSLELPFLPDSRLRLAVALQGGIELVLEVDSDEVVRAELAGDARYLGHIAAAGALPGATVRVAGGALEVVSDASEEEVNRFVTDRLDRYEHAESTGRIHRFELTEERRHAIEDRAVTRIVERTRRRLRCVEGAAVEDLGGRRIAVDIPGEVDLGVSCPEIEGRR